MQLHVIYNYKQLSLQLCFNYTQPLVMSAPNATYAFQKDELNMYYHSS
jgi:hypothetical protein